MLANITVNEVVETINNFPFMPTKINLKIWYFDEIDWGEESGYDITVHVHGKKYKYFTYAEHLDNIHVAFKVANELKEHLETVFTDIPKVAVLNDNYILD